jgi:hypothetical protein
MRIRCVAAVIAGIVWCLAATAHADPRTEVAAKARAAMASYDSMDYEAARRLLNQALAIAKRARLDKDPIVARVYLDLGITQLAGSDQEAARVALLSAAQIDPRISIDAAYRSPELVKLLDEAKAAAGGDGPEPSADVDCKAIRGLRHVVVDAGRPGAPQPIEVLIGGDLAPSRVAVMYRPEGAIDFSEIRLTRQGGCRYAGAIPGTAMRGSVVHYYIAAYDAANKVLASKGSSGAPNVLELRGSGHGAETPAPGDAEDPIGAAPRRGPATAAVTEDAAPPRTAHKTVVAFAGGTGFGYVTGRTEGDNQVQKCCIGSSLVVALAEIGYHTSARLSLGFAARIGFPIGANIAGHSTIAPAGFLRARYALSNSGDGIRVMGELGAGILRNTIKLDNTMPGMDTDVVAQGPLLLGAGIGYVRHVSESLAFLVDFDAVAGIAIAKKLGSAVHLNTGISADMRLGLSVGF